MNDKDLKQAVLELAQKIGKSEARRLLVLEGISPHTADKVLRGCYESEIGALVEGAIQRAIAASKEKAS